MYIAGRKRSSGREVPRIDEGTTTDRNAIDDTVGQAVIRSPFDHRLRHEPDFGGATRRERQSFRLA